MQNLPVFPLDTFLAYFPEFADKAETAQGRAMLNSCGMRAVLHVGENGKFLRPVDPVHRQYCQCLMAAHIYVLSTKGSNEDGTLPDPSAGGEQGMIGATFKATIGSVQVENTKPNTFVSDDWMFWLSQTKYGLELLAYMHEIAAPVYMSARSDSVRDLP